MISTTLRIVAVAGSIALLLFVVELVRRRRLKEEYTVLWVTTALLFLVLAAWGGLLRDLTQGIGAISEASTLFFFGILFVIALLLHFSLRVSSLERRVIALLQEVALLREARSEDGVDAAAAAEDERAQHEVAQAAPAQGVRERGDEIAA
jgi:hypothetical protein